jgi:hypothetical protein
VVLTEETVRSRILLRKGGRDHHATFGIHAPFARCRKNIDFTAKNIDFAAAVGYPASSEGTPLPRSTP